MRKTPDLDYDSAQQTTPPAGTEGRAALIGHGYKVRLTPAGRVLDVNGVEESLDAVRKKLPAGADVESAMRPLKNLYLNKQYIKNTTEQRLGAYPDKPVEQGESWSRKGAAQKGDDEPVEYKWTLQGREAGTTTIGVTLSFPLFQLSDDSQGKSHTSVTSTGEGTIRMDEATGLITTCQIRVLSKSKNEMQGEGMSSVTSGVMEATFTFEMSDKMWKPAPK